MLNEELKIEIEFYRTHKKEMLAQHEGLRQLGNVPMLIHQVLQEESVERIPNLRLKL